MTLGSLFDGSGGFPLAASMCGIEPIWASEIEPYPIAVTRSRFPAMIHLGDISKVNGAKIPPVDVCCFGSPCQDMSVAGLRSGMKHEGQGDEETTRSGLFYEAVRIIKQMRRKTNGIYPRYVIWENVCGAFSSREGADFRAVLAELIGIADPTAVVPPVPAAGWAYADAWRGEGWSLAWRVFDAQYWGVPQRRRRIYLVADFRGGCAEEILFKREVVRGYFAEGGTPWERAAADIEGCAGAEDREGESGYGRIVSGGFCPEQSAKTRGIGWEQEKSPTLRAGVVPGVVSAVSLEPSIVLSVENHPSDSRCKISKDGKVQSLTSRMGTGGGNVPLVLEGKTWCLQGNGIDRADTAGCNGKGWKEDISYTQNTIDRHAVAYCIGNGQVNQLRISDMVETLNCMHDQQAIMVCDRELAYGVNCRNGHEYQELYPTLQAKPNGGQSLNFSGVVREGYIVRRLTPTECARLQGFPDLWGHFSEKDSLTDEEYAFWLEVRNTYAAINGKQTKDYSREQILSWYNKLHTDSAEYKMWGNGIALPCALYVMQGIKEAEHDTIPTD